MFDNFLERFYTILILDGGYKDLLEGLYKTLYISIGALVIGIFLGTIFSTIKVIPKKSFFARFIHVIADIYITVIRGTPVVVQLLLAYFVIFAKLNLEPIVIAIIVFGVNSGAYVAEIIRAGILAVDKGQMEAGRSLGLSFGITMRKIILPQAIKNILPALGNEFIVLIKETSVAGYVTVIDLTKAADSLISKHYNTFVPYLTIAVMYLAVVMIATKLVSILERKLRKSDIR